MRNVFGILVCTMMALPAVASNAASEDNLIENMESMLDATLRCERLSLPIGSGAGNQIGSEFAVWWQKRKLNTEHIQPYIKKVKALALLENVSDGLAMEREVFRIKIEEKVGLHRCPALADGFFDSVDEYVQFLLKTHR